MSALAALSAPAVTAFTPATSVAFEAVFGVFVAAMVVLAVVTLRWAVRRDQAGRAEWLRRRARESQDKSIPHPRTNGHVPHRRGQRGGPRRQA